MGDSMISDKETEVIEERIKVLRKDDIFRKRTPEEWVAHNKRMEELWHEWDLPPASITPEHYVISMQWQVAPSRLTAKRLREALEEDLGVTVFPGIASNMLDKYGYFEGEAKEASMGKEKYHYARRLPKEVDVYENAIHKHYVDWKKDIHEGSIRVVKPTPEVLVYLGCLLKDKWDEAAVTCSPNPTVVKTITPNTKKYLDELEHLKFVHPEIKVNYHKEISVEPKVGEAEEVEEGEAHSIEKALKEIGA